VIRGRRRRQGAEIGCVKCGGHGAQGSARLGARQNTAHVDAYNEYLISCKDIL
jgi:hypothetical protein